MRRLMCDKCCNYYGNTEPGSDYFFCDKCGRLLISLNREAEIVKGTQLPRILFLGDDPEIIWSLRRALYDPRDCVSSFEAGEVSIGLGGVSRICSKSGDVAVSMTVFRDQLKDTGIYAIIADEDPSITVVVLDCLKLDDVRDYVSYLKKHTSLMKLIRPWYDNPLIVVLANADQVPPSDIKVVDLYPESKHEIIQSAVDRYKAYFSKAGVEVTDIFPISSFVEWGVVDLREAKSGIMASNLEIITDGRYNISRLRVHIEESIHEKNR